MIEKIERIICDKCGRFLEIEVDDYRHSHLETKMALDKAKWLDLPSDKNICDRCTGAYKMMSRQVDKIKRKFWKGGI